MFIIYIDVKVCVKKIKSCVRMVNVELMRSVFDVMINTSKEK